MRDFSVSKNPKKQVNMQDKSSTVLDILQSNTEFHNASIRVNWGGREGTLHIREGDIFAAEVESLSGNGAALDIARWKDVSIADVESGPAIRENVTLSLNEIGAIFQGLKIHGTPPSSYDDQESLNKAILLVHQFKYREAMSLISEIIKYNRFNYLAWIWCSRLLGKVDGIRRTLGESQKWGSHALEVRQEAQKVEAGLTSIKGDNVKRCLFCWAPINRGAGVCSHCNASQAVRNNSPGSGIKKDEIREAINLYGTALKAERTIIRTAYVLAIAFYNLKSYDKSLQFANYILKNEPDNSVYKKTKTAIESLTPCLAVKPPARKPEKPAVPAPGKTVSGSSTKPPVQPQGTNGNPVIMVVEDSPTARQVIKMVLTREGFGIVEAATGREAINQAGSVTPSLILLDVMLPDMTGYDILPQLREHPHLTDIPVVMLTGKKGSADRLRGMQAGSSEYLTKPFNPQKLTTVIKKYI